jgi:hypothetical protein
MAAALVPFAPSLAINIFIVLERTASQGVAVLVAVGTGGAAQWFWFGTELLALKRKGVKPMATRDEPLALGQKISQLLTEARVILPGAQAPLGFRLAVALTQAFDSRRRLRKRPTPAPSVPSCHGAGRLPPDRLWWRSFKDIPADWQPVHAAATMALAFGLTADIYVVITKISASNTAGALAGTFSFIVLPGLWQVSPALMRRRRK